MTGAMRWITAQLLAASQCVKHTASAPHYNPNPRGTIHDGSTTEMVLCCLQRYAPRYLPFSQIVDFTGCPPKSVSWALHHLRNTDRVEARASGDPRSPFYQMYRVIQHD